jgi:hypothetical protein
MMIFKGINRVTQAYGGNHGGIDIVGDTDPTVRCVADGTVYLIQKWDGKTKTGSQSYGNLVIVIDDKKRYYYAHLKSIAVKQGQKVKQGDTIGIMGSTGNSTGPHVHFEVRTGATTATRIDPTPYCGVENRKGVYTEPYRYTSKDGRRALQIAARLAKPTPDDLKLLDMDGDGKITTKDAREVLRKAAKLNVK